MPLSYIGKKVEENRKKKELPSIQELIDRETGGISGGQSKMSPVKKELPSVTSVSTPQTATPAVPLQPTKEEPKQEEDRLSNIERFRLFEGQTISQGGEDPVTAFRKENPLKKVPVFGDIIFGTQGEGGPTFEEGSFQRQFVEQGLVGFFTEGFGRVSNPTQKELAERIDQRVNKLQKEGYDDKKALDLAIQDVIDNTPGTAQNLADLKNPNIELTNKEKDILKWVNLTEDVFAVLDAPVFVGSTKPVKGALTAQGEKLVSYIESTKDVILKRLKEPVPVAKPGQVQADILSTEADNVQEYIKFLEENKNPSLNEINEGLQYLKLQGKTVDDLQQGMEDIVFDIKTDPAPYIQDPVTGKMQGRRKVNVQGAVDEAFTTEGTEITTKILNELEGKTTINKQFISDLTNRGDIKQAERDAIREVLEEYPEGKINAKEFGEKVQARLLPVQAKEVVPRFESSATLPDNIRGEVKNYGEIVWESPIKTSGGTKHGFNSDNYFSHTRYEELPDNQTVRILEEQSDLFQKSGLESEFRTGLVGEKVRLKSGEEVKITGSGIEKYGEAGMSSDIRNYKTEDGRKILLDEIENPFTQLQPYRNNGKSPWWQLNIRNNVKFWAERGKTTLQFPTGETAMKIEGIGSGDIFTYRNEAGRTAGNLTPDMLKVGKQVRQGMADDWIITEVLEDGKFKAAPKRAYDNQLKNWEYVLETPDGKVLAKADDMEALAKAKEANPDAVLAGRNPVNKQQEFIDKFSPGREKEALNVLISRTAYKQTDKEIAEQFSETFDISGKVDTNNPIYKFYEKDVQKYLTKNYDAKKVTDENGVSWIQMDVKKELASKPVEAFAGLPAGYEEDEEGNITIDPTKAFLGMAAAGFLGKRFNRAKTKSSIRAGESGQLSGSARLSQSEQIDLPKKGQTQYPLTTDNFSQSLSKEYQKITGKSIDDTVPELGKVDPKSLTNYKLFTKGMGEAWTTVVENIQDNMVRVRNLVENPNVKISEDTDPYLAEILFHGRVGARLEQARDTVISIDRNMLSSAEKNGVPDRDMSVLVNKYLHARHTPERNAALGDGASGLTTADALEIKAEIEALPYSEGVIKIADEIQELNNQTLDVLLDGQVIDKELYDTLRNKYKTHVPLQRVLDDQQDMAQVIAGKGFDVRSSGVKRAKGSDKDVADILANVVTNFEQAIIRAEKNRVDLTTLQFARDNKNLGLFEEIKPRVIGKTFGKQGKIGDLVDDTLPTEVRESLDTRVFEAMGEAETQVLAEMELAEAGSRIFIGDEVRGVSSTFPKWIPEHLRSKNLLDKVREAYNTGKKPRANATKELELLEIVNERIANKVPSDVLDEIALTKYAKQSETKATLVEKVKAAKGDFIFEKVFDPTVLELMENGKKVYLKINDESLAMALKGVNKQTVPYGFKTVAAITRFYSGLQTRFNPEFAFPNKIRDLQEMVVYAGSRQELGFKGGVNATLKKGAYKGVLDYVRGADTDMAKLYKQMMDDGGTTGGISLSTREAIDLDIAQIRKQNRSNPRAAADKVVRAIDDFNRLFEDSTRLAVYKEALDRGASRKKAAMLAKEASVNFNKFGKGGPLINALWMFSNAGIQGTTKFIRAMKNPKVAAITATSVYAAVHATGEWNDTLDPEWRDKVPEWDRTNGLPVVLPPREDGSFHYFVLPVAWGIKPMKVTMDYMYDLSQGYGTEPKEAAAGVLAAFVNAYNPLGGTDTLSMATPTILDIPSEIARNQAWHGGVIRPDWDQRKAHLQYFSDLKDSTTGEIAVKVTNGLSKVGIEISPASFYYAYQGYIGGAGRTATDALNTMASLGRGKMPDEKDIPIWSRFVKTRDNEVLGAEANFYKKLKDKDIEADSERAQLRFDAEEALAKMESVPQEEAAKLFEQIAKNDPELAEKLVEIKEENDLGLTYTDRALKNLGVQNGDRAEMILDRMKELKSDEERAALWNEYVEKKIITKQVAEQIVELRNQ